MFTIELSSSAHPFEQLRMQIIDQIKAGTLAAGAKLPTVRHLAETLDLAPNTVARCYRELEADGFIETRGRNGSFVNATGDASAQQAQVAARAYADRIRQLGVSPADALAWATAALRD